MELGDLVPVGAAEALRPILVAAGSAIVVAGLFDLVGTRVLAWVARRTTGNLDDRLLAVLRRPLSVTILLGGAWYAAQPLALPAAAASLVLGVLATIAIAMWSVVGLRLTIVLMDVLEREGPGLVQRSTRPLLDVLVRVVIVGGGVYFLFLAWGVDVTGWLASAGIVGIVVGLAAQDTLANLFSGLSILADRPYQLGDYLVIDDKVRGRVTQIGMRSTRLLTRDDVEVIIPNSQMAAARILNESGGPHERERVSAVVGVAYDADLVLVRRVLLEVADTCGNVVRDDPAVAPRVRLRELGDFALQFHLLVWIPRPELRGLVLDELNTLILERFRATGISIPFPIRTVQLEGGVGGAAAAE